MFFKNNKCIGKTNEIDLNVNRLLCAVTDAYITLDIFIVLLHTY